MSSPGIVTYPLGGITYDAEDAAAYFSTRTSGVFSTEEDFAVTVAEDGGTAVTVGAGRAWMHVSRFTGQSVTLREARTVELPFADSNLPRIDAVVLRYDATARATTLEVLQGPPSSEPAAPAISRTELVYDLCLCQISRPAGQTALTAANLTDTRADEALCGLMRDGVTALPMEALGAQALAKAKETAKLCDKLLASYTGGYLGIWPVTLPADGWPNAPTYPATPTSRRQSCGRRERQTSPPPYPPRRPSPWRWRRASRASARRKTAASRFGPRRSRRAASRCRWNCWDPRRRPLTPERTPWATPSSKTRLCNGGTP